MIDFPQINPSIWIKVNPSSREFNCWKHAITDMLVFRSISKRGTDNSDWIHISVSYKTRTPSWDEMCIVKSAFLGDIEAYQVMPLISDYVNVHSHCLHIWAPVNQKRCVVNLQELIDEKAI